MSDANRPFVDLRASCACGAIELTLNGKVASMLMCSCQDCQKASGTGHATVALVPADSLTISGDGKAFGRPSDSGATFTRHFCPACGTPLFGHSSRAPDLRMVPVGFFVGQNDWFAPTQLIFARSRQEWDLIADHLPKHDTYRPERPR